jgi:ubiquinone/menaquinone biosynthesis C-methylase UbiE
MKRVVTAELLDEDLGTPEEVRDSLLDLRGINQKFGGFRSIAKLLATVARRDGKQNLSFLDVAGGTGDVAEQSIRQLSQHGISVKATVLDRAASHMNRNGSQIARVAAVAQELPFASGAFDVVCCNLFLHHLEEAEMLRFFREALRVARTAVIASDLRRNHFHWLAAYAGRITYRSRLTRNDAPASVRRAYTIDEMKAIAQRTGAASFNLEAHFFQRFGLILWKAKP